ncbi:21099_t:CDS:2 [Dentiscutata erythropus]|uniref:21099_t:CDS:1 n=1 Tax=Dentiscutata erythropus TaxID=1348616 RepID=A0A9N9IR91_9GLOM|nr:21099_t:CDS:2 [Dentiscutata erythropus]
MNENLFNQLLKFSEIYNVAKTSLVSQWNIEYLQNSIQCAFDVENALFMISDEDAELLYKKLVSKAKTENRVMPPLLTEFQCAYHLFYRALLRNIYLPSDLYFYVLNNYEFLNYGLFSKQENIAEDVQMFAKPLAMADVLAGIQTTLLEGLSQIKPQKSMTALKHEYSYKLLHTTTTRRAAARLLLKDLDKFFDDGQIDSNGVDQIKNILHHHSTQSSDGMEIIFHAAIFSFQPSEGNLQSSSELNRILLNWITSFVNIGTSRQLLSLTNSLESGVWQLHPWLLSRLSFMHQPFFEIYSQMLIQCTRQEQQHMHDNLLSYPKRFYDSQLNDAYQRLKSLLHHWELLHQQFGDENRSVTNLLQQEWFIFKEKYENLDQYKEKDSEFKIMFTQVWKKFFLEFEVRID